MRLIVPILLFLFASALTTASADATVELTGTATQGGLLVGRAPGATAVEFEGRAVRVSPAGVFLVGFGRDAPPTAELVVTGPDGNKTRRLIEVAQRDYRIQRIDGLPESKVTPPAAVLERIRAEGEKVGAARAVDDPRTDFLDGFIWPLTGRISGVYGSQRILNGEPRRPHYGVDVAAETGTPVMAPADAVVRLAEPDLYFSGGTLIMDHGHGLTSTFIHLSKILVAEGQAVRRGEIVAEVGATGRATGPHLDWRMNLFDTRLDPQLLTAPMPDPAPRRAAR
jgi:murein DD-endopeptidase MepM/ murein hydrolase activator NlpD